MTDDTFDPAAWLREQARQRRGRVSRDLDEASRAHHATADKLTAAADRLDAQQAEIERLRARLRRIAELLGATEHREHSDDPSLSVITAEHLRWHDDAYEIALGGAKAREMESPRRPLSPETLLSNAPYGLTEEDTDGPQS